MKKTPDLRLATARDIAEFTNGKMTMSCKAIVAKLDGEILGIGGIYYRNGFVVAFSDFNEKMIDFPFTRARATKMIMDIIGNKPCIAIADDRHSGSEQLLIRLGFKHVSGRTYEWQTR